MAYEQIEILEAFDEFETKMDKSISSLQYEFNNIKAGRANPHILDKIVVDYYGVPTPLKQIGNIQTPEARVLMITVWDTSILKEVEKAIIAANTGITPNNDGKVIRMIFPELTQERRKELCKGLRATAENTKVALRNARRDINDSIKKFKKDSLISEDEASLYEKDVDKKLAEQIDIVDKMSKEKEQEILSV
ncbi:MAG: ribosome recycling factor [Clostridiales bacterium]|nr:ribosome recycling factor [Clostridiales bacterium]MBD5100135.1 ribosome recycling factor [Clostridiales bacterium]